MHKSHPFDTSSGRRKLGRTFFDGDICRHEVSLRSHRTELTLPRLHVMLNGISFCYKAMYLLKSNVFRFVDQQTIASELEVFIHSFVSSFIHSFIQSVSQSVGRSVSQ